MTRIGNYNTIISPKPASGFSTDSKANLLPVTVLQTCLTSTLGHVLVQTFLPCSPTAALASECPELVIFLFGTLTIDS
jgi:hypothetical protein